jgi:hypothetical protein
MPKKTLLRVLKKTPKSNGVGAPLGNDNALISGAFSSFDWNLDGRSKPSKNMELDRFCLIRDLGGDLSKQKLEMVDRAVYILARCRQFESNSLNGDSASDQIYLAWVNTLRLILRDLGYERVPKDIPSLQAYLAEREAGGSSE